MPPRGWKKESVKVEELPEDLGDADRGYVSSEKEQLAERRKELLEIHTWMTANAIRDLGQLEVKLAQVNQRLTELP